MADCHNLFQEFHQDILIPKSKKNKMTKSRDGLRDRVRQFFKENQYRFIIKSNYLSHYSLYL